MSEQTAVLNATRSEKIALSRLHPNPWNRKQFDPELLKDLVASIKAVGILEPLIVRPNNDGYEIASGNRRYLAAKEARLQDVPCEIHSLTDEQVQDMNLISNIQREEISPLEKAQMIQARMDSGHLSQEAMAATLGKSRSWLTQVLGFLSLPQEVQKNVADVPLGLRPLRAIASLSNRKHQIQVSRELKDGTLKPASVHHRVRQLQQKKSAVTADPAVTATPAGTAGPVKAAGPAAPTASPVSTQQLLTALKDDVADNYLPSFGRVGGVLRQSLDTAWQRASGKGQMAKGLVKWGLIFVAASWLWQPVLRGIHYALMRVMPSQANQAFAMPPVAPVPSVAAALADSPQKFTAAMLTTVPAPTGLKPELLSDKRVRFTWNAVPGCAGYNFYSAQTWKLTYTKENKKPITELGAIWWSDSGLDDFRFVVTALDDHDHESIYSAPVEVDLR